MIYALIVVVLLGVWAVMYLENLAVDSKNRLSELEYKLLLPSVREYAALKGGTSYTKFGDKVVFGNSYFGEKTETVHFDEMEDELRRFKASIERNCAKKCPPTKKSK